MKQIKKILSLLLVICMIFGSFPANTSVVNASENTSTGSTLIAMSDYQNSHLNSEEKKVVPQTIVNAMKKAGVQPELALLCGDYVDGSVGADGSTTSAAQMENEFGNLKGILTSVWSNLKFRAIQGNHDAKQWVENGLLDKTGAYEYEDYHLYLINEDDFPWWQGNYGSGSTTAEDKVTVTNTANALKTYLDGLISKNDTKPVIIATHVPMHWSVRSTNTAWYYDNIYANILFDVVNKAGKDLDILFLFGHNHSATADNQEGGYDVEIGGALSYVKKGDSMKVPDGTDGTDNYTTEKLNFTYMNAGYVGKYNESTADCSISAITVNDKTIDIARYTYNGKVDTETIALTHGTDSSDGDNSNSDNGVNGDNSNGSNGNNGANSDNSNGSNGNDGITGEDNENTGVTNNWVELPSSNASVTYQAIKDLNSIDSSKKYMVVVWRYFGNSFSATTDKPDAYVFHSENNGNIKVSTDDDYQTVTSSQGTIDDGCYWKMTYNSSNGTVTMQNVDTKKYLGKSDIVASSSSAEDLNIVSGEKSGYTNYAIGYDSSHAIRYSDSNGTFSYSNNSLSSSVTGQNACNITLYEVVTTNALDGGYARLAGGDTVQNYDISQNVTVSSVLENLKIQTSTDGANVGGTVSVTSDMVEWSKTFNGSAIGTYVGTISYKGQKLGTVIVNVSGEVAEVTGTGDWTKIADGKTTYKYELVTSISTKSSYVIVGNNNDIALMNKSGNMGSQSVTISDNGNTLTSDEKLTEWTFSGTNNGTIKDKNENYYLRYNNGYSLSSSSTNLTFGKGNSNFTIYTTTKTNGGGPGNNKNTYNYFYYNGSNWTVSSTTNTNNAKYVRLYNDAGSETTDNTYARLNGTLEQVYRTTDKVTLDTILDEVKIETSTDEKNVTGEVSVTSDMVKWDYKFDGSTAGVYTGTVTYEEKVLGTIKVTITPVSVTSIKLVVSEGSVTRGASANTITDGKIEVTYSDGKTETKDVTLGMLNNDGSTVGTFTDLTVTYGGKTAEGFTLTVNRKSGNDYPTYPNEGAVKVGKNATGIDFQSTGVAKVELTASGIPMNQGIDVVVVLDTSSSMQEKNDYNGDGTTGDDETRLAILRPALNSLIQQLQTTREDGSEPDLDISIVAFNGFTGNGNSNTEYGAENYIEVKAYATPNEGGVLTNENGDGWVDIMALSTDWADKDKGNIKTGSGTNYDEGLLMAYNQLVKKQESWETGETRQQFVVFMSDGAPFQYNGVYSNYTSIEWNEWLLGNYKTNDDIPDTVTNKEYYVGYAGGNGQDHRIAEAIKGNPEENYQIITTTEDTNGKTEMTTVNGLGATMYSIGYLLKDNGKVLDETQNIVLKNIASADEYYYDVDSVEDLNNAFTNIASAVLMSAYNAYYVDTMGEHYDIQLASTVTRSEDNKIFELTERPAIEIREYEIWTRAEYDAKEITDLNQIGTRKTDSNGNFKYKSLENVTFNDEGTQAYTGGDKTNNILIDGVICANTFWYNTNSKSVMVDKDGDGVAEFELAPETFLWKIGTLTNSELAMTYFVYLDGTMEGQREAGSYATNESAILYYDNYLGNPCQKETVSPTLAWESASVSYAFYLVNEKGEPVNMDGDVVPFKNRVVIINPTLYDEVYLNNQDEVRPLEVIAKPVLPEGYALYNEDVRYKVTVHSEGTGSWKITDEKEPVTTYVGDYNEGDNYSNELETSNKGYDYTHTTVWFAVKWEPKALPDTVVVDYGLPVDVHVLANDMFGKYGTLKGVAAGDVTEDASKNENSLKDTTAQGSYGNAEVIIPDHSANEENSVIRYTQDSMEMNGYDKFTYSVQYTNTNYEQNNGFYYSTVTVIPATTIYYEENFVTFNSYTWDNGSNKWTERDDNDSLWEKVTDGTFSEKTDITQDEDRPGDVNYAFDTKIDANNVYGYDSAYKDCAQYSLGSAMKAQVDYNNYASASFSFYGTGFDVISLTSDTTGSINVIVKDENGNKVRNTFVDTYYGYTKDDDGNWVVNPNANDALYQVPVMEIAGLDYGKYDVEIRVIYDKAFDHKQYSDDGKYDFYLDAIRIYDPAGDGTSTDEGNLDDTIQNAYKADKEGWPMYEELRNNVIDAADSESKEINGIVFVDGISKTASVEDYKNYGPNNELYLAAGQGIIFELDLSEEKIASVQLGMKSADGSKVSYKIFNGTSFKDQAELEKVKEQEISTSTGMYYDITSLKNKTIVIYNSGKKGILSLTDIKFTFTEAPDKETLTDVFCISASEVGAVIDAMNTEPEVTFTPEKFEVAVPDSVTAGSKITVKVTTGDDVAAISVDGEMLTAYAVDNDGNRVWTQKVSAAEAGVLTIEVTAYNEDGVASDAVSAAVTVNSVETALMDVIRSMIEKLKNWFG